MSLKLDPGAFVIVMADATYNDPEKPDRRITEPIEVSVNRDHIVSVFGISKGTFQLFTSGGQMLRCHGEVEWL